MLAVTIGADEPVGVSDLGATFEPASDHVASRRIVWHYGTPGVHGHGSNQLWNPDDAIVLPDGHVLVADIKNCRILLIAQGTRVPERIFGADRRPSW